MMQLGTEIVKVIKDQMLFHFKVGSFHLSCGMFL